MHFVKMHGLGNDYIYVDCFAQDVPDPARAARLLSRPHYGIGADGLILILPSDAADCRMRMFNADGSEGAMCGNGIRCVGKYLYDHGRCRRREITVETQDGVKNLYIIAENGRAAAVRVDMGTPKAAAPETITAGGADWRVIPVDVGSPHAVCIVPDCGAVPLAAVGPQLEHAPRFPDRVNCEFVTVLDRRHIRMRVWERGSGITLACGTGACASAAACYAGGLTDADVDVKMDGGTLHIELTPTGRAYMTGPAVEVFAGEVEGF